MSGVPSVVWFVSGIIAPKKLDGYVLSPLHPTGQHKARLWRSIFGIKKGDGELLEHLIREQLDQAEPVEQSKTKEYRRWELIIPRFRGPNNKEGPVLTAWALVPGNDRPHLTTTYPKVVDF